MVAVSLLIGQLTPARRNWRDRASRCCSYTLVDLACSYRSFSGDAPCVVGLRFGEGVRVTACAGGRHRPCHSPPRLPSQGDSCRGLFLASSSQARVGSQWRISPLHGLKVVFWRGEKGRAKISTLTPLRGLIGGTRILPCGASFLSSARQNCSSAPMLWHKTTVNKMVVSVPAQIRLNFFSVLTHVEKLDVRRAAVLHSAMAGYMTTCAVCAKPMRRRNNFHAARSINTCGEDCARKRKTAVQLERRLAKRKKLTAERQTFYLPGFGIICPADLMKSIGSEQPAIPPSSPAVPVATSSPPSPRPGKMPSSTGARPISKRATRSSGRGQCSTPKSKSPPPV